LSDAGGVGGGHGLRIRVWTMLVASR
jgi:hypothetical protein